MYYILIIVLLCKYSWYSELLVVYVFFLIDCTICFDLIVLFSGFDWEEGSQHIDQGNVQYRATEFAQQMKVNNKRTDTNA